METIQNPGQPVLPEITQPEPSLLYDPDKTARIADHLRELLNPDYILLFGSLAGGTPHSRTSCYDLFVLVDQATRYNWLDARRYLRMVMPNLEHRAPFVNIYVHTQRDVEAHFTPFFYLTRREGIVLYHKQGQGVKRPRKPLDFGQAAAEAQKYSTVLASFAGQLREYACTALEQENVRMAAFTTAQAAVCYFRTLFYVYHGYEAGTSDMEILHHRLRTISGELYLLFEADCIQTRYTLPRLKSFLNKARYDPDFFIAPDELALHLERVDKFADVVDRLCTQRIALYRERGEVV